MIVFRSPIDQLAISIYATELVLWLLVLLCGSFMSAPLKMESPLVEPESVALEEFQVGLSSSLPRPRRTFNASLKSYTLH
jgi:hypothetical protein